MSVQTEVVAIVGQTIREFCLGFLDSPYLCYTEHGLHALLYTMLYNLNGHYWERMPTCVSQF
jgi:hypothetical protein